MESIMKVSSKLSDKKPKAKPIKRKRSSAADTDSPILDARPGSGPGCPEAWPGSGNVPALPEAWPGPGAQEPWPGAGAQDGWPGPGNGPGAQDGWSGPVGPENDGAGGDPGKDWTGAPWQQNGLMDRTNIGGGGTEEGDPISAGTRDVDPGARPDGGANSDLNQVGAPAENGVGAGPPSSRASNSLPPSGPSQPHLGSGGGGGIVDGQFMPQQNQIFVFSTGLANQAAEAVQRGVSRSIVDFHLSQPNTRQFLQNFPLGPGVQSSARSAMVPPQYQNDVMTDSKMFLKEPPLHSLAETGSALADVELWVQQQNATLQEGPFSPSFASSAPKSRSSQQRWTGSPNRALGLHPGAASMAGEFMGPDQAVMGPPGFNDPTLGPRGGRVMDENLTPERLQRREEQLAHLEKIKQMLFPEKRSELDPRGCRPMGMFPGGPRGGPDMMGVPRFPCPPPHGMPPGMMPMDGMMGMDMSGFVGEPEMPANWEAMSAEEREWFKLQHDYYIEQMHKQQAAQMEGGAMPPGQHFPPPPHSGMFFMGDMPPRVPRLGGPMSPVSPSFNNPGGIPHGPNGPMGGPMCGPMGPDPMFYNGPHRMAFPNGGGPEFRPDFMPEAMYGGPFGPRMHPNDPLYAPMGLRFPGGCKPKRRRTPGMMGADKPDDIYRHLQPAPSPQQFCSLNLFEGQELTITRQLNLAYQDPTSGGSSSGPAAAPSDTSSIASTAGRNKRKKTDTDNTHLVTAKLEESSTIRQFKSEDQLSPEGFSLNNEMNLSPSVQISSAVTHISSESSHVSSPLVSSVCYSTASSATTTQLSSTPSNITSSTLASLVKGVENIKQDKYEGGLFSSLSADTKPDRESQNSSPTGVKTDIESSTDRHLNNSHTSDNDSKLSISESNECKTEFSTDIISGGDDKLTSCVSANSNSIISSPHGTNIQVEAKAPNTIQYKPTERTNRVVRDEFSGAEAACSNILTASTESAVPRSSPSNDGALTGAEILRDNNSTFSPSSNQGKLTPGASNIMGSSSGSVIMGPNGPVIASRSASMIENGPMVTSREGIMGPNGPMFVGPDPFRDSGPLIGPNGQIIDNNGPMMVRNGPMMGPNGPIMGPNGPMMAQNGPMIGPGGRIMGPNGPMDSENLLMGPNGPPHSYGNVDGPMRFMGRPEFGGPMLDFDGGFEGPYPPGFEGPDMHMAHLNGNPRFLGPYGPVPRNMGPYGLIPGRHGPMPGGHFDMGYSPGPMMHQQHMFINRPPRLQEPHTGGRGGGSRAKGEPGTTKSKKKKSESKKNSSHAPSVPPASSSVSTVDSGFSEQDSISARMALDVMNGEEKLRGLHGMMGPGGPMGPGGHMGPGGPMGPSGHMGPGGHMGPSGHMGPGGHMDGGMMMGGMMGPDHHDMMMGSEMMMMRGGPMIGPDGRPIIGPDGRHIIGPEGRPMIGPDGRHIIGPDGRAIIGPDGMRGGPMVGPDGMRVGPMVGPDGMRGGPMVGPEGMKTGPMLGPDGMRPMVGPDGMMMMDMMPDDAHMMEMMRQGQGHPLPPEMSASALDMMNVRFSDDTGTMMMNRTGRPNNDNSFMNDMPNQKFSGNPLDGLSSIKQENMRGYDGGLDSRASAFNSSNEYGNPAKGEMFNPGMLGDAMRPGSAMNRDSTSRLSDNHMGMGEMGQPDSAALIHPDGSLRPGSVQMGSQGSASELNMRPNSALALNSDRGRALNPDLMLGGQRPSSAAMMMMAAAANNCDPSGRPGSGMSLRVEPRGRDLLNGVDCGPGMRGGGFSEPGLMGDPGLRGNEAALRGFGGNSRMGPRGEVMAPGRAGDPGLMHMRGMGPRMDSQYIDPSLEIRMKQEQFGRGEGSFVGPEQGLMHDVSSDLHDVHFQQFQQQLYSKSGGPGSDSRLDNLLISQSSASFDMMRNNMNYVPGVTAGPQIGMGR